MCAMNALVTLMLSVGYGLTEQYRKHYTKIFGVCLIYFITLIMPLFLDHTKQKIADNNKYEIFVLLFTVGIMATISFFIFRCGFVAVVVVVELFVPNQQYHPSPFCHYFPILPRMLWILHEL